MINQNRMRVITTGRTLSLYIYPERQLPELSAIFAVPVDLAPAVEFASVVELA